MSNKKEGLIYDDGKLRECPSNIYKIGFWKTLASFHGWRREANELKHAAGDAAEALAVLAGVLLFVALLPVSPMIRAFLQWRKAVKQVRRV